MGTASSAHTRKKSSAFCSGPLYCQTMRFSTLPVGARSFDILPRNFTQGPGFYHGTE